MLEVRHAFRMLVREPVFVAIAVMTLGLGIGANTAMFSVVSAVLLEPLPYKDVDRLMVVTEKDEKRNQVQPYSLSYLNFQDWRATQHSFDELALFRVPTLYKLRDRRQRLITADGVGQLSADARCGADRRPRLHRRR